MSISFCEVTGLGGQSGLVGDGMGELVGTSLGGAHLHLPGESAAARGWGIGHDERQQITMETNIEVI